jgi:hypothetical protein
MDDKTISDLWPASPGMQVTPERPQVDAATLEAYPRSPGMFQAQPAPPTPAPGAASPPPEAPADDEMFPNSPGMKREPSRQDGAALAAPAAVAASPDEIAPLEGMAADDPIFAEFKTTASELGIKPDAAQRMLDLHQKTQAAQGRAWQEQVAAWGEEARSDPEIGGSGFDQTVAAARGVLDKYGTPELRSLLDRSGLGNHRAVIALLAGIARDQGRR